MPVLISFDRPKPPALPTRIPSTEQTKTITFDDEVYAYSFFIVDDLTQLSLHANFTAKTRANMLSANYQCLFAANGGFYDTDNQPLGSFISSDYTKKQPLQSQLFNGFFSIKDGTPHIASTFDETAHMALQSGPRLIDQTRELHLAIQNDEHARRTVVAITDTDKVIFFSFYIHDSIYNGPLLESLPTLLQRAAANEHLQIREALNLDGGSASFFKTPEVELPELSPVGSIFCLQ